MSLAKGHTLFSVYTEERPAQELSPFFKTKFLKCGKSGTCRLSLNYQDITIDSYILDLRERDLRTRATLSESSK
jgi:hypothetical protein